MFYIGQDEIEIHNLITTMQLILLQNLFEPTHSGTVPFVVPNSDFNRAKMDTNVKFHIDWTCNVNAIQNRQIDIISNWQPLMLRRIKKHIDKYFVSQMHTYLGNLRGTNYLLISFDELKLNF